MSRIGGPIPSRSVNWPSVDNPRPDCCWREAKEVGADLRSLTTDHQEADVNLEPDSGRSTNAPTRADAVLIGPLNAVETL
jgi:hypothetical protein